MLSKRLKLLRKEKGITQEQLADILHVERSSIGKYESPSKPVIPSSDVLIRMSDYFNVSLDYLLGKSDTPNPPELVIPDILKNVPVAFHRGEFEDLTQDEVDALASIAETLKKQRRL